ncbi:RNA 3'-terminal phosphate cyclase [Nomia melanderi]|uniref:RNA 3'-terminal phosphate cyclase n=1 Tax=Nomia melanderi TaxID=2448451 RepID=UPI0013042883|nr:RNA 3'-terminal phosphate cyclase [Nomia melanderi]
MMSQIQIDGSLGEGGGQVLRIALTLSALYKIPVKIDNIRAGRPKPGLAAQHLKGVELLQSMCNAEVQGAHIGSTCLEFKPNQLNMDRRRTFMVDIGTAGCIGLLVQVAVPCALFFPPGQNVKLILKGGTNVPMGPHIDYLTNVFTPLLHNFGVDINCVCVKRGYYPKGGGEVHVYVPSGRVLNAVTLMNPGVPTMIHGDSHVAGVVPIKEAYKMAQDAKEVLLKGLRQYNINDQQLDIRVSKKDTTTAYGNGSAINLQCLTTTNYCFGGSGLGSGRQQQIAPGVQAANEILNAILSGSCVDEHAQDQLIIFMALASGTSKINLGRQKLTSHTETAMKVVEIMLKNYNFHFQLSEKEVGDNISYILECKGCGYKSVTA